MRVYTNGIRQVTVFRLGFMSQDEVSLTIDLPEGKRPTDFVDDIDAWLGGELIQNVFSYLDADQREFLMTGMLPGSLEDHLGPEVW